MEETMKKAVIYARTSSSGYQENRQDTSRQVDDLKRYAGYQNLLKFKIIFFKNILSLHYLINITIMSHKITKTTDGQKIIMNIAENVFDVNYREYFLKFHSNSIARVFFEMITLKDPTIPYEVAAKISAQKAFKLAKHQLEEIEKISIPKQMMEIITTDHKKKEQEKILKGLRLTAEQLGAVFSFASNNGYKYSSIRFEGIPKNYNEQELPSFAYIDDEGNIHKNKATALSDNQIKALIRQSPVIIAQIFDNGNHWFCFIRTFKGLKGEEPGKQGSIPHLHFLTDKAGCTKEELINCIINDGTYPNSKVHIPLVNYR